MKRIVCVTVALLMVAVLAVGGCGLPSKGNELGLVSARLTTEVLRQNLAYATDVREANDAFADARREMARDRFKATLKNSATAHSTNDGDVHVISVDFASKQVDDYDAAVAKMMADKEAHRDVFESISGMIQDAIETQEDWVRYLLETADWNERQTKMFNSLLETAFTD